MKNIISTVCAAAICMLGMAAHAQQVETQLIDELVTANRVLAGDELGVLGVYGHVSARSELDRDRFYISRNIAPPLVTAQDIITNDLDGDAVAGQRNDQYEERFIDAAIYKARPDVMAIVHSHAPDLIAFSVSSIPLPQGDSNSVPVYDLRRFNDGKIGEITTLELGESLAQQLGSGSAILLLGHGAVTVASSVPQAISGASNLRASAAMQAQMIAMGGDIIQNPRGLAPRERPAPEPSAVVVVQDRNRVLDLSSGRDRGWHYWRQLGPRLVENSPLLVRRTRPSDPVEAAKQDLVIATRILADSRLGIFDTAGHISVRNPEDPNRYFISRAVAPGAITVEGLIENDLDSRPVDGPRDDSYTEAYIHGEIYKSRPDVMAIIHAHTPELVAFSQTTVKLRAVSNGGAFIGNGLPLWRIGDYDPTQSLVATAALGRSLAEMVGDGPGALLTGHGIAITDTSLYGLVNRTYNLRLNAIIQQKAILLGGNITYLEGQEDIQVQPATIPDGAGGGSGPARFWEYWSRQVPLD